MTEITYKKKELVNLKKIDQVLKLPTVEDKQRNLLEQIKKKKFISQNGSIASYWVTYKYSKTSNINDGRIYAQGSSLQHLDRNIRNYICEEFYEDIDIVNCIPVLAYNLANLFELECKELTRYVERRQEVLDKYKLNKEDVFKVILKSELNNGAPKFVQNLHNFVYRKLIPILKIKYEDKFKAFQIEKPDVYNPDGKFFSLILFSIEAEILQHMDTFFSNGLQVDVFMFDGCQIRKNENINKDLLIECSIYVKEKTRYSIDLSKKNMNTNLIFDDERNDDGEGDGDGDGEGEEVKSHEIKLIADLFCETVGNRFLIRNRVDYYCCDDNIWYIDPAGKYRHMALTSVEFLDICQKEFNTNCETILLTNLWKQVHDIIKMYITVDHETFFFNPTNDFFAFKNGLYDLTSSHFRAIESEDYISTFVEYNFNLKPSSEDMLKVEDYLSSLFLNQEETEYVWKVLASMLPGRQMHQSFYIGTGDGENGKSYLIRLLHRVLGKYAEDINANHFTEKSRNSNDASPAMDDCKYARAVFSSEPEENSDAKVIFNSQTIKYDTGDDEHKTRPLYGKLERWIPKFLLFLICNAVPGFTDLSHGFHRRICLILFRMVFTDNPNVENPFEKQRLDFDFNENFLQAFVLRMIKTYNENFLTEKTTTIRNVPKTFSIATKQYFEENNPFNAFFANHIERDASSTVNSTQLFMTFKRMYPECGMTQTMFSTVLVKKGVDKKHTKKGNYFYGIRVVMDDIFANDED
jgi:P4 family phage/plasmid primase-like protien